MSEESVSTEHLQFYERFQSFLAAPSRARVAETIAPHAKIHFNGEPTMTGATYVAWITNQLLVLPDLVVIPVDFAGSGNLIYIYWKAAAIIQQWCIPVMVLSRPVPC